MCLNTDFKHNEASQTLTSLRCTDATQLSEQDDKGNLFLQGSGTAVHEGQPFDIQTSQFIVYDANMDGLVNDVPYSPETIVAITDWFTIDDTFDGDCEGDSDCDLIAPERPGRIITSTDVFFSNSTAENTARGLVRHWESGLSLYGRMQSFPTEMMGVSPAIDAFYQDASFDALGAFWRMDHNWQQIYVLPDAWQQDVQQALVKLDSIDLHVAQTLSQLASTSTWNDSMLVYFAADSINQIAVTSIEIIIQNGYLSKQFASSLAEALLLQCNGLPDTNLVERNRKAVLACYATLLSQQLQTSTTSEFLTIDSIAHQCPLEGGSAVYIARSLYQLVNRKFFDDENLCNTSYRSPVGLIKSNSIPEFLAVPNPTSNTLKILSLNSGKGLANVQIFNANGHRYCARFGLNEGSDFQIDVAYWPVGLYIAVLETVQGELVNIKFLIQR